MDENEGWIENTGGFSEYFGIVDVIMQDGQCLYSMNSLCLFWDGGEPQTTITHWRPAKEV